jgi:DNA polymerase elongation subunit (family B)
MEEFRKVRRTNDSFGIWRFDENIMTAHGLTMFKGFKSIKDISTLSFDLETTGLDPMLPDAKIIMISNTFDKCGTRTRKLFSIDEFENEGELITAWSKWVKEVNPSVILGHNIFDFDIPYLLKRAYLNQKKVTIARDNSVLYVEDYLSSFRKDQTTFIDYRKPVCFGRHFIDTRLMAIDYDRVSQTYPNYKLKDLAKYEGVASESRIYYDAKLIRKNYMIPEEMEKIKIYAENDADEALDLYYIFCQTKFLMTPYLPKGFQNICLSATGSLCNSLMVRAYLQQNYSIAEASEKENYEGAISLGNTGIYKNVFKIDVSSLYPSIMLTYKVRPEGKDDKNIFLTIVSYFTKQRLQYKALASETGDKYYTMLEQVQKVFINSFFGFLGAPGFQYNCMRSAETVTRIGRQILLFTIKWSNGELPEEYYEGKNENKENP